MATQRQAKVVDPTKKSPEQIEAERIADLKAQEAGKKEPETVTYDQAAEGDKTVLIHVVAEWWSALGQQWGRGQEIEFPIPSESYSDTFDRNGRSWLVNEPATKDEKGNWTYPEEVTLRDDYGQIDQWGEVRFRAGPWRGKGWDDNYAEMQERERNRAAPVLDKRV